MAGISEGFLQQNVDLRILCATTHKHPWRQDDWPKHFLSITNHSFIDTKLKISHAIGNLFEKSSYNVDRFYNKDLNTILVKGLQDFKPDVVWVESLFMLPYLNSIRENSKAKVILRAHNVEYMIWERLADNTDSSIRSSYLSFLAKRLKDYELEMIGKVDAIATLTDIDRDFFSAKTDVAVKTFPIGINMDNEVIIKPKNPPTLFHLGAMNWQPNEQAMRYFVNEVWPKTIGQTPQAKCTIAGREMPKDLLELSTEHLTIMDDVKDAHSFFMEHDIMVLPLLSGGGMRVKLLEAMAMGKVVISSSIGAEGVPGLHNVHFLIADSPEDMAKQIKRCYSDEVDLKEMGMMAQQLVESHFSHNAISKDVTYFCQTIAEIQQAE